ncbi:hypothetical protein BDR05DRAFT_943723 [Suillus weaverae]|nr:hypothetical protein BDR05DRAFT_943723 [Suillus weaverae]
MHPTNVADVYAQGGLYGIQGQGSYGHSHLGPQMHGLQVHLIDRCLARHLKSAFSTNRCLDSSKARVAGMLGTFQLRGSTHTGTTLVSSSSSSPSIPAMPPTIPATTTTIPATIDTIPATTVNMILTLTAVITKQLPLLPAEKALAANTLASVATTGSRPQGNTEEEFAGSDGDE